MIVTGGGTPRSSDRGLLAHGPDELLMDELQEVLLGRQAAKDLLAEGLLADRCR